MEKLQQFDVKGIARYLLDQDLGGEPLHLHISEVGPGGRSHPPHQHGGYEAIYMLDGEGVFEIGDERHRVGSGEAVVFDPHKLHGLVNESAAPMRYMVVMVKE
ncbi:MAG: cupin domain-containing protein [Caldilineaceae bacterium]|nr:cupin domain-containing protein [Caldilineaceae bacterium]